MCALSGRHRYHLQCIFHTKLLFSGAGIALQTPIKTATGRRSGLVLADLEVIIQTLDDLETTLGSAIKIHGQGGAGNANYDPGSLLASSHQLKLP